MAATKSTQRLTDEQQAWLTDVYRSNFGRVFRLCRRLLRDPDDAVDATHEVFMRAVGAYQARAAGRDVGSWLLTVARNYCVDVLRRRQRLSRLMVRLSPSSDGGVNPETSVVDREAVAAILDQLRVRERQALWASAVEHRSLAAIAQDLRLSYMATAQLLHRARRHAAMLAKRLAAIFGLVQLGRLARRAALGGSRLASRVSGSEGWSFSARQLVAGAALPIALVVVVVSTAPARPSPASGAATGSSPLTASVPGTLSAVGPRAIDLVDQPAGAVSGVVQQAVPVLGTTLSTVEGPVNNVTRQLTTTTTDVVSGLLGKKF
jgi:RNA polymerase sigma factor (sigma-70 family)